MSDINEDAKRFGYDPDRWFDMINAMDEGEYLMFIKRLEQSQQKTRGKDSPNE